MVKSHLNPFFDGSIPLESREHPKSPKFSGFSGFSPMRIPCFLENSEVLGPQKTAKSHLHLPQGRFDLLSKDHTDLTSRQQQGEGGATIYGSINTSNYILYI